MPYELNDDEVKLSYSEHHQDYADGMTVKIGNNSFRFSDFNVILKAASDRKELAYFFSRINLLSSQADLLIQQIEFGSVEELAAEIK